MRSIEEIVCAAKQLCARSPKLSPSDLTTPGRHTSDELEWNQLEYKAWTLGEVIRQTLVKNPKLKASPVVLESILEVVECRGLRRGRQSFLLSLSFAGAAHFAPRIAPFLKDNDVSGHALNALIRMRAIGYAAEVVPLLDAKHTWVRKLANQYLERYPVSTATNCDGLALRSDVPEKT